MAPEAWHERFVMSRAAADQVTHSCSLNKLSNDVIDDH